MRVSNAFRSFFLALLLSNVCSVSLSASPQCALNSVEGRIKHVVYVQFDNVHFTRDNPNVPSDLEQMPNLLNFIRHNGTLLTNHHTPLISHTADDIITSLTGVYPNQHGEAVANSYLIFTPTGFSFPSSFTYWTDPVNPKLDPAFNLIDAKGNNAPAPWVPFTRAGCNVGAVSIADMEVENTRGDLVTIFGPTSAEVQEANIDAASKDPKVRAQPAADFEGIAVHCAAADALCSTINGGVADVLPQEPNGYLGFNGLFGHKFVAPAINSGNAALNDLDGNPITDEEGNTGFPGFGPITASQSLSYVASMLEHNVPVVFAYISDAHEELGPGEAAYVARLATYNKAWGEFFNRLAADGINRNNTLFVITSDEGDHFEGQAPTPANCDGINIPCTYPHIGEITSNIADLLQKQDSTLLPSLFDIHFDMAPAFYIKGQPDTGNVTLRSFEKATAKLTVVNPVTGNTDQLTLFLADHAEMKLLHMITADPLRTPSFVMFGNPNYFFTIFGPDAVEDSGFAWNHGGVAPEINTTFLGLVGPGVRREGIEDDVWSDHTDIRPTLLELVGLQDDYDSDGRVLAEVIHNRALPHALRSDGDGDDTFVRLAQAYKKINAPVGDLGLTSLAISTKALAGDDTTYTMVESEIGDITNERDALAAEILSQLKGAEFEGKRIDREEAHDLLERAERLLDRVHDLKSPDDDEHHDRD